MAVNLLELITGPLFKIIDKLVPDPAAKAAMQLQMLTLQQNGEFKDIEAQLQMAQGQIDTNKIEAGSTSFFRGGWRPFIGWICGTALGVQFLVAPLFTWIAALWGHPVVFPSLDMGTLMTLLTGMLGLGALRTVEKTKGIS